MALNSVFIDIEDSFVKASNKTISTESIDINLDDLSVQKKIKRLSLDNDISYKLLLMNEFCTIFGSNISSINHDIEDDLETIKDGNNIYVVDYGDLILSISNFVVFINSFFYSELFAYKPLIDLLTRADRNVTIDMYINSRGGAITTGLSLIDYMETSKATIRTIVPNFAASMGALVWAHGDQLVTHKSSIIMFHSVHSFTFGNIVDLTEKLDVIKDINQKEMDWLLKRNIITQDEYNKILQGEDVYILGEEFLNRKDSNVLDISFNEDTQNV